MEAVIQIKEQSAADRQLLGLMGTAGTYPLRLDGAGVYWPHSVIRDRTCKGGVAKYTIERIDTCPCGKPIWPLPFTCDDCFTTSFSVGT